MPRIDLSPATTILSLSAVGLFVGYIIAANYNPLPLTPRDTIAFEPYCVPKVPGGTALRLAMVHDVLMNRYAIPGEAWYAKRNESARALITAMKATPGETPSSAVFNAYDDLAVGLDHLGQHAEAAALMREKLSLLPPIPPPQKISGNLANFYDNELAAINDLPLLSPDQHHTYTAHANLGTILIHQAFPGLLQGDPAARAMMEEGLSHIDTSIEINPVAHFGRERWQAIVVRHFLALRDHPDFITKYSIIGDDLDHDVNQPRRYWHIDPELQETVGKDVPDPITRRRIRSAIYPLFPDVEWLSATDFPYRSVPFDEPTLALLGMWTLGGGPNPHSALALARIMETIGQHYIAWEAYERALDMADRFSPDPAIRQKLIDYCTARRDAIQKLIPEHPAQQKTYYDQELAKGTQFQKDHHDYEAAQIAAGVSLNDPRFYDTFAKTHDSIASPPGHVDEILITHRKAHSLADFAPCAFLGLAIGMSAGVLLSRPRVL